MEIQIKRIYEKPEDDDGFRVLVDRLWPRGLSKENAKIDDWPKEIAPSDALRRWYGHDPEKWPEFQARYFEELDKRLGEVKELMDRIGRRKATFLFGSREEHLNNAQALREYVRSHIAD